VPGVPIAYPRMVFLETTLGSKFNPLVALGKTGSLGLSGMVNKFNGEAELLDDLVGSNLSKVELQKLTSSPRMIIGLPRITR
jgi:hypothetical protein